MKVVNKVGPNEEQMKGFMAPGHDGPIYMLNLLKFKEKAEYADGRETDLTGAEAYGIYGTEVVAHLAKVGGAPMFSARVERLMLGEVEDLWDSAAWAEVWSCWEACGGEDLACHNTSHTHSSIHASLPILPWIILLSELL